MPADGHFAASPRLHASSPSRILTLPRRLILSPPRRLAPRLLALSCQEDEHLTVLDSEMLPKGMEKGKLDGRWIGVLVMRIM
nr:hypothetical protein Iba_chr14bCG12120 [Ipomoea batatas]